MSPAKRMPLLLALGLSTVGALAEEPESAPAPDEIEGEIVFGPQYFAHTNNRDSAKFEEFRDVPNNFTLEHLLFDWVPKTDWFLRLDAVDVSQDDQRLFADFGNVDRWRASVYYLENPRRWSDQAQQLFANNSDSVFTLEDSFQSAVRAAPSSSLPGGDLDLDGKWDPGSKGFLIDSAIRDSAHHVDLGHQREQGGMALEYTPTRNWILSVAGDRERREGTTPQNLGMYFAHAPAEVAAPIDFRTDTATAGAEYVTRRFNAAVELQTSDFETGNKSLTWDNQLFLNDEAVNANQANPGHGRLTFATDNELERVALRAGANLPAHTRIDASYASTETTQDDAFLPMTINSLLNPAALPAQSLDGEYDTTSANLRISSRPTRSFRFNTWWRSYDVDNKTPSLTFADTVSADYQFGTCANINLPCDANGNDILDDRIPRRNLPYGYKRDAAGALVGWAPIKRLDAAISYEREDTERDFSAVEDATSDNYKLTVDVEAASWLSVRSTLRYQERRADDYDAHYLEESFPNGEPSVAAFNEGSRRFYWTDRDRDSWAVQLDATPAPNWGLYAEASYYQDDYIDPETGKDIGDSFTVQEDRNFDTIPETYDILLAGRTEDEGDSYSLGVTYSAAPRFDVYADYTLETFDYSMASRYRNISGGIGTDDPLDNWSSDVDDDYDTASLGFNWAITADRRWTLRADASRSVGTSDLRTDFVPGGSSSGDTTLTEFPEVKATLELATLVLERKARENLDYSLRYWYESWEENNFASDFNEPYMGDPNNDPGSANSIFLGVDFKDYTNHIVSFLMRYRY